VGDEREFAELFEQFSKRSRDHGWRIAVVGAGRDYLGLYRRLGLRRAIKIGDEAVVSPQTFSTQGRAIRKVRQAARKVAERDGVSFRIMRAAEAGDELRLQLEAISSSWLAGRQERGFSMAIDDLFVPGSLFALALDASAEPIAFLHFVPGSAGGGYSLSSQRRLVGCPGGTMDYLVVETLRWARENGVRELSLNFCAFRDLLHGDPTVLWHRLARRVLLALDTFFQIERLNAFSRKFLPEWRPRYICLERMSDLPAVGVAYLRAESLVSSPRRLSRKRPVDTTDGD
jgi:lysyl-tRNA synthetase class 2